MNIPEFYPASPVLRSEQLGFMLPRMVCLSHN